MCFFAGAHRINLRGGKKKLIEICNQRPNKILEVYSFCVNLQVLSGNFLNSYGKDIINIHHGLLPSFKGGNPSKQVQSLPS